VLSWLRVISVLLLVVMVSACAGARTPAATTNATSTHSVEPQAGTLSPAPVGVGQEPAVCRSGQLKLAVATKGSTMSQPFMDVSIRTKRPCRLRGYPSIRAWAHGASTSTSARLKISLSHGLYERADAGPHTIVVTKDHPAMFSLGTDSAYQGGRNHVSITRFRIALPGSTTAVNLHVDMRATFPPGKPVPIGITALQALVTP
jgi:hypothetical protein